jgi:hypothetical protein
MPNLIFYFHKNIIQSQKKTVFRSPCPTSPRLILSLTSSWTSIRRPVKSAKRSGSNETRASSDYANLRMKSSARSSRLSSRISKHTIEISKIRPICCICYTARGSTHIISTIMVITTVMTMTTIATSTKKIRLLATRHI